MTLNGKIYMDGLNLDELLEALRDIAQTAFKAECAFSYRCEEGCPYKTLCDAAFDFQRDLSCRDRGSRPVYKAIAEMLICTCADETTMYEKYCYERALSALMDLDEIDPDKE